MRRSLSAFRCSAIPGCGSACESPCPWCGLGHAGFESVSDGHVLEIPGLVSGWESGFSVTVSVLELRLIWRIRSPRVWLSKDRHGGMPSLLVWSMPLFFSKAIRCFTPTGCCLEKDGSGKLDKACSAGEIEGTNVLDGTIVTSSDSNGLSGDSSSCSEAKVAAVTVEDDRSSCKVASTVGREVQFFVNYGKGSMVVQDYAVCGTRFVNRTAPCWHAEWETG